MSFWVQIVGAVDFFSDIHRFERPYVTYPYVTMLQLILPHQNILMSLHQARAHTYRRVGAVGAGSHRAKEPRSLYERRVVINISSGSKRINFCSIFLYHPQIAEIQA